MIDETLLGELKRRSDSTGRVSMVVEWLSNPNVDRAPVSSRRELQRELESAYREMKRALLAALETDDAVSVEDLPSSPKAIVTATPRKWTELMESGGAIASHPRVRVLRDVRFEAL